MIVQPNKRPNKRKKGRIEGSHKGLVGLRRHEDHPKTDQTEQHKYNLSTEDPNPKTHTFQIVTSTKVARVCHKSEANKTLPGTW